MRLIFFLGFILLPCASVLAINCDNTKQLYMPDAQLKSHSVKVYLTDKITSTMRPRLKLISNDSTIEQDRPEDRLYLPLHLANDQNWEQEIEGHEITCTGTVLLFDLKPYPIPWYKAVSRLTPVLIWNKKKTNKQSLQQSAIGSNEVYIGNLPGALLWTLIVVIILLASIIMFVRQSHGSALFLLTHDNNRLSLAKAQIAAWTVAIGGMILGFGLIRLEVPEISNSILTLMGLSLATGGVSFYKRPDLKEASNEHNDTVIKQPKIRDLILIYDAQGNNPTPSLARAQMVFWTGLVLILFVAKSILDGVLWQVPWEMVILMGMSQASYLTPKIVTHLNQPEDPVDQQNEQAATSANS